MSADRQPACVVAVTFDGRKAYDYLSAIPLRVGQSVTVETKRGEQTVTVVEVKSHSERATAWVKSLDGAEPQGAAE